MHIFDFKRVPMFLLNSDGSGGGGGSSGQGDGDGSGGGTSGASKGDAEKKFTQADVDRLLGERAQRASEAATTKLLESFGVKTPDEIKAALEKIKTLEDAQKSELQKAQDEASKFKAESEKRKVEVELALAKANERLLQSAVMLEAQRQSVDDAEIVSVWRELKESSKLREKIKQDDEGEFEGVGDVVKEIVKQHPKWLKAQGPRALGTPNRTDQQRGKSGASQSQDERIGVQF